MSSPQLPSITPALVPSHLRVVLALIGLTAITAQIVLMRELMLVFYGNEISLGVMLASWLLWTAIGSSFLGRLAGRANDPRKMMAALQLLLALTFPVTILAVRSGRIIFRAAPGEILGPGPMFLTCLAALSCFCAVSGCLFAVGSRLYAREASTSSSAATGSVYLLEAAGSAMGGILASLFLIRVFNSMEIALLVSLLNLLAATSLAIRANSYRRALTVILVASFVLVPYGGRRLEALSLAQIWPGFRLVASRNSVYGNLTVVENQSIRSLFENSLLMFNAPDPAAAEEAVHFALLEQPAPRSLLLIGGGASGSLLQALQHPSLERVDYVELDPAILDVAQQYFPEQWNAARADPRVDVHSTDGRLFLKTTKQTFDVILVDLPDPQTAQLNRFYTLEFFQEAAEKLNGGGIFSFQLHAAEEYISPELGAFLRCINKTLREAFPVVTAIPGETAHFFAAKQGGVLTSDPQELLARLRSRHIQTRYVREYYIPFRMTPDRMLDLSREIEPRPDTPVNRDFAPIAYYFDVALWGTQFNQAYRRIFQSIAQVKFSWMAAALGVVILAVGGMVRWWPRPAARNRASAGFCIAAAGLTLIGLEVMLLLGFQAVYGYVYHQLAIVIAFFMAGIALGSWWALRQSAGVSSLAERREMLTLTGLQGLVAVSPIVLYLIFTFLAGLRNPMGLALVSQFLFPLLALLSGVLGGYQFIVASGIFFAGRKSASLGTLYAVDLAGACLGALAMSAYLLPVFGFLKAAALIAAANLVPGLLAGWLAFVRVDPQAAGQPAGPPLQKQPQ